MRSSRRSFRAHLRSMSCLARRRGRSHRCRVGTGARLRAVPTRSDAAQARVGFAPLSPPYRRRMPMKLKLHHVNLCSTDLGAMDKFYREVLDMETEPTMARQRIKDQGYPGD